MSTDTDTPTGWPELERAEALAELEALAAVRRGSLEGAQHPEPQEPPGPRVLDLSAATELGRTVKLPAAAIRSLGVGELALVASRCGVPIDGLAPLLRDPERGPTMLLAMAWALARRLEPDVTWEEAQAWRVEVVASAEPDPTRPRPDSW